MTLLGFVLVSFHDLAAEVLLALLVGSLSFGNDDVDVDDDDDVLLALLVG